MGCGPSKKDKPEEATSSEAADQCEEPAAAESAADGTLMEEAQLVEEVKGPKDHSHDFLSDDLKELMKANSASPLMSTLTFMDHCDHCCLRCCRRTTLFAMTLMAQKASTAVTN